MSNFVAEKEKDVPHRKTLRFSYLENQTSILKSLPKKKKSPKGKVPVDIQRLPQKSFVPPTEVHWLIPDKAQKAQLKLELLHFFKKTKDRC